MLVGANEDVLAGQVQDLVPTIDWKEGLLRITNPLLPVMVMEGKGWGDGHQQS